MDRPGVQQVQDGSGEQGKLERDGYKVISDAANTLVVKGLMIIIIGGL